MSEYRAHPNLTSDPPVAAVYARLADLHDDAARTHRPDRLRPGLRPTVAAALRRLAAAIEPTPRPAPSTCGNRVA